MVKFIHSVCDSVPTTIRMDAFKTIPSAVSVSFVLKLCFVLLCLVLLVVYNWKRRWLYYYSAKLPGPFSMPLLGSLCVAFAGQKNIFPVLERLVQTCPPVWRTWIANKLYIFSSRPQDVEVLLSSCLSKKNFELYDYQEENISSIFTSPVDVWKVHRKIINPCFNQQIINSFTDIFVKYAHILNLELDKRCNKAPADILPTIWRCTLDTLFETLADVNPNFLQKDNDKFVRMIVRYEELLTERFFRVWLRLNFLWRLSPLSKELASIVNEMSDHIKETIELHKMSKLEKHQTSDDSSNGKIFLSQLLTKELTPTEVHAETLLMFMAGSETTALTMSSVLLVLGIYPDIQVKIYEEQCLIFGDNIDRDATLDDVNRMHYLERVIKETMRLLPPAPYLARSIDQDVKLDSHCIAPAGSGAVIPVWYIHKNPEYWPDPLTFDPDRFLPEEVEKRPRSAYLAFSYGSRNCVGLKYGMMSMKTVLSTVLRQFRVLPGKYKSIDDIEVEFHFVGKAKEGYQMSLERRKR